MYKLDRTIGIAHNLAEDPYKSYWQNQPMIERLKAAYYLNSVAYDFPIESPARMDKKKFNMRKLSI